MRNLLLLLLLANILYFLWGMVAEEAPQSGVTIIREADLGPPLEVASVRESSSEGVASGRSVDFEALVGQPCVTIGPFNEAAEAENAAREISDRVLQAKVRSTDMEVFVGHWVQIRDVDDDAAAEEILGKLSRGGLKDAYLVRTEDEGLKISLGLFQELDRAEKVELDARSLDLPAEIGPRTADRTVYFVDVELPQGHGAGAIVDEYGEELVLLRGAATCPQ